MATPLQTECAVTDRNMMMRHNLLSLFSSSIVVNYACYLMPGGRIRAWGPRRPEKTCPQHCGGDSKTKEKNTKGGRTAHENTARATSSSRRCRPQRGRRHLVFSAAGPIPNTRASLHGEFVMEEMAPCFVPPPWRRSCPFACLCF